MITSLILTSVHVFNITFKRAIYFVNPVFSYHPGPLVGR